MSTVPPLSGPPLYRYIPGVGKVASSIPGIQGPTGPQGVPGTASFTGATGPAGSFTFTGSTGSVLFFSGLSVTGSTGLSFTPGANLVVAGSVLPSTTLTYSLGSTGARWSDMYVGPGSINIKGPGTSVGTIGTDSQGIVYTETGFATPFVNIGPAQLTPSAVGGWKIGPTGTQGTANFDLVAQENSVTGSPTGPVYSLTRNTGPTETCASAFSTTDQTLVNGTAANIAHTNASLSYGITVTTGANSYFQVPTAGIYKIIPSIQYLGDANETLILWIKVNGSNVADTGTLTKIRNNEEGIITCEYLLDLSANAQVQVWGLAQGHNGTINYIAGGGSAPNAYPASPGVITNMYRIR